METKVRNSNNTKLLKRIADSLLTAQQEIDELLLQLSLGKAEAKDKFEEIKQDLRHAIQEFKKLIRDEVKDALPIPARKKLDDLISSLNDGKVNNKIIFTNQQKKIAQALEEVEHELKDWLERSASVNYLSHEIEKYKLKMEILWLKFGLKNFELKDEVKEGLLQARKKVEGIAANIREQIGEESEKMGQVKDKIKEVYRHTLRIIRKI
ncbi:hypothetical protein SanaruYs_06330 [Chryseotalea sanaruensis]|uniref:Uncharacterized protein n=1 Tax=Chryseotalea sanaruensis TaxID=2482724 RepID=A0A401U660_9BACT|nr:hypothetical protein [Chryseotalea sanaruensis]GCC50418.1 hypothetical protein SanaruYs_06330 [Chryseotalea sanaruensis]